MLDIIKNIDTSVFLFLNGYHNSILDFLMFWFSNKPVWIPFYAFLIYLIIKNYGKAGFFIIAMALITITIADQTSVHLFKEVFKRLRPCHEPALENLVHLVKGKCGGQYGFISSHAVNSFALASYIYTFLHGNHKPIAITLFIWAGIVSFSRVYLGVHYPGDILTGAAVGLIIGFSVQKITWYILKKTNPNTTAC